MYQLLTGEPIGVFILIALVALFINYFVIKAIVADGKRKIQVCKSAAKEIKIIEFNKAEATREDENKVAKLKSKKAI